jgi:hypothetical protein
MSVCTVTPVVGVAASSCEEPMIRTSIFSASLVLVALAGCDDETNGTGGGGGASSTTSAGTGGNAVGGEDEAATTSATGSGGDDDASTTGAGGEGGSNGEGDAGGAGGEGGSGDGGTGDGGTGTGAGGQGGDGDAEPGTYEALVEGDGAILHFPFEEDAPPFASVASSHEATCDGCTPHVPSTLGRLGHGVEIGSANQTIAVSPGIELTNLAGVTFEVWITPKAMDEATVLEWVAPDGELYTIYVDRWQDGLRAHWLGPNGGAGAPFCSDAETCIDHTFAIVGIAEYGANDYASWLFVDGAFRGGFSAEGSPPPYEPGAGLGTLRLGSDVDGSGAFTGVVDEFAIYGKALDDAQIAEHFDAGIE